MRDPIKFTLVTTNEQWNELAIFAATFNHVIDDRTMTPLYMMHRGSKMFGYFVMSPVPMIFPAFHTDPSICSPRDFIEAVDQARAAACMMSISPRYPNGQCWLGIDEKPQIETGIITKLGFTDINKRLFQFT